MGLNIFLTLYENRSWTTQVKTASLPTGTVKFAIGELKFGSGAADFFLNGVRCHQWKKCTEKPDWSQQQRR